MRFRGTLLLVGVLAGACVPDSTHDVLDHVELQGATLTAEGLVVSMASATVDDAGNGTGAVVTGASNGRPPLEIDAPRTHWDLKARSAVFEGGVVAKRGEFTLRCDTLTVAFAGGPGQDAVEHAVAEGHVIIERGGRTGTGERAELTGATGEIVLTGKATLVEGMNTLSGERVTLWLDDEKLDCVKCHLVVDGSGLGSPR